MDSTTAITDAMASNEENPTPDPSAASSLSIRTPQEITQAMVRKAEMIAIEKEHLLDCELANPIPDDKTISALQEIVTRQRAFAERIKAEPGCDWSNSTLR